MANLITTKEKYGISVATRLDPQLAHEIAAKADRIGVSLSKMVGMIITDAVNSQGSEIPFDENRVEELEQEIQNLQNLYKNAMSQFIDQIAEDDEDVLEFIQQYNEILEKLKAESHD